MIIIGLLDRSLIYAGRTVMALAIGFGSYKVIEGNLDNERLFYPLTAVLATGVAVKNIGINYRSRTR